MAMTQNACCAPDRGSDRRSDTPQSVATACSLTFDRVDIPGGAGLKGTRVPGIPDDGESPLRTTQIKPFAIGRTAVTVAEFREFVRATGYQTEAERFGWSFVFHTRVPAAVGHTMGIEGLEWWRRVDGALWSCPDGPGTEHAAPDDHPVTQVSWADAQAFATWAGGRLPTEAEWEHAARGGLGDVPYPWGDADPDDIGPDFRCNIWQGHFPHTNTGADGWDSTAPAMSFAPNGYGLYNMVGNTWEWTSEPFRIKSLKKQVKTRLAGMKGWKLSKGGSFLCHRSYCFRYRIAARSGNSPDSAAPHHGFRMVWDG